MMQIVVAVLLVSLMLWAGLQSPPGAIRAVLRDYGLLSRAILLSVIVVPALAVIFSRLLHVDPMIETGIIIMAASGGVPFLPLTTKSAGGDMPVALSLVFVLALISVVTAPLTANLVSPEAVSLPIGKFALTLVLFQLVPLLVGLLINATNPAFASVLRRVAAVIGIIALVTVLVLLAGPIAHDFGRVWGTGGILAMVGTTIFALIFGWLFGGKDRPRRVDVALATELRNPGLALLIANTSFPKSIVVSACIVYFVVQALVAAIGAKLLPGKSG
jgi:BASS family bile acid:Na+ symporter